MASQVPLSVHEGFGLALKLWFGWFWFWSVWFLPSFPPSFPPSLPPSFPPSLLLSLLPSFLPLLPSFFPSFPPSFPASLLPSLHYFFLADKKGRKNRSSTNAWASQNALSSTHGSGLLAASKLKIRFVPGVHPLSHWAWEHAKRLASRRVCTPTFTSVSVQASSIFTLAFNAEK